MRHLTKPGRLCCKLQHMHEERERTVAIVGYVLVGLGLLDWALSLPGIDLYQVLGITLPPAIAGYSAILAIAAGAVVLALAEGGQIADSVSDMMQPGERLIFCRRVRVRTGRFGPAKSGFLFLSDQRIGYWGDLPKAFKYLQDGSLNSTGFVWDLKDLTSVKFNAMALELVAGTRAFRAQPRAWLLQTMAGDIQRQINAGD